MLCWPLGGETPLPSMQTVSSWALSKVKVRQWCEEWVWNTGIQLCLCMAHHYVTLAKIFLAHSTSFMLWASTVFLGVTVDRLHLTSGTHSLCSASLEADTLMAGRSLVTLPVSHGHDASWTFPHHRSFFLPYSCFKLLLVKVGPINTTRELARKVWSQH